MGNAEGKIEFLQDLKRLLAEPGFVSEFKGMPKAFRTGEGGEEDAELLKSLFLKFEPRWELPEDYSQFLFQRRSVVKKKGEGFPAILQPFDVCDEPASLDRKRKFLRCAFMPASKNLFPGQAIKGDVQLDRVKMLSIEFEPLSLGEIGGVEDTIPPMGVIVAAGTNKNHNSDFRIRNSKIMGRGGFSLPLGRLKSPLPTRQTKPIF